MRLLDVIEYQDNSGQELVHRIPDSGPADIRTGAQLIVRETQAAVFWRDGKALDVFGPGRHTLTTANLPLIDMIVKFAANGQTPFQAEVYFVSQKVNLDQKWGTPHPIPVRDKEYGPVMIRAFGSFTYAIHDPQLFIGTIVGTQGLLTTDSVSGFLKSSIVSHLNNILQSNFKSILDAYQDVDGLSAGMKALVKDDFGKYGLEVRDFFVQEITLPDNLQAAFEKKAEMNMLGTNYAQMSTFDVMKTAAGNPSGTAGAAMGLGAGFGMGQMMPQMMQNAVQPQAPVAPPPPQQVQGGPTNVMPVANPETGIMCTHCQASVPPGGRFCMSCGTPIQTKPTCPNCHADLPAGAHFCMGCGTKIG